MLLLGSSPPRRYNTKMGFRWWVRLCALPFLLVTIAACAGGNSIPGDGGTIPAAPPAPPVELPSTFLFPDPRINVDELALEPSPSLSAFVGSGGEFSAEINIAENRISGYNDILGAVLDPIRTINIPVDSTLTQFTAMADFPVGPGVTAELKLDFTDFDFNGDGNLDGCSGTTCPVAGNPATCPSETTADQIRPICVRMWADGEALLGAVFEQIPTDDNPGIGQLKVRTPTTLLSPVDERFIAVYNHADPEDIRTEAARFSPPEAFALTLTRAIISQQGPEGFAQKTINLSESFDFQRPSGLPDTVKYIGSYLQDRDFWSGSLAGNDQFLDLFPDIESNFSNVCAQLSTGNEVNRGICQDLNIDVEGIEFIDFAKESDFTFFDFPEAPTF